MEGIACALGWCPPPPPPPPTLFENFLANSTILVGTLVLGLVCIGAGLGLLAKQKRTNKSTSGTPKASKVAELKRALSTERAPQPKPSKGMSLQERLAAEASQAVSPSPVQGAMVGRDENAVMVQPMAAPALVQAAVALERDPPPPPPAQSKAAPPSTPSATPSTPPSKGTTDRRKKSDTPDVVHIQPSPPVPSGSQGRQMRDELRQAQDELRALRLEKQPSAPTPPRSPAAPPTAPRSPDGDGKVKRRGGGSARGKPV